jgi:hypothetical protein
MPRSGTTLIAERLASHRDVWIGRETHFFPLIGRRVAHALKRADFVEFEAALRYMTAQDACQVSEGDLPVAIRLLRTSWPFHNTTEAFLALIRALSDGSPVVGEKTPRHLEYVRRILRECPSTRVLICLRDPRAVYASTVKVPWGSSDPVLFTARWAAYADEAHRLAQHFPAHVRCLRYEDVVADQGVALQSTWTMLGLLAPKRPPCGAKTFSPVDEPWKEGSGGPIRSGSLHRWKSELDPSLERELIDRIGPSAARFGYEIAAPLQERTGSRPSTDDRA